MNLNVPTLKQRDRASLDFVHGTIKSSAGLKRSVDEYLTQKDVTAECLPDDLDDRNTFMLETLGGSSAFRVRELLGEWLSRNVGATADEAFDNVKEEALAGIEAFSDGPAALYLDDAFRAPDYWDGVHFHRTDGGWDAHEYSGYVHGELIHRKLIDRGMNGAAFAHRRAAAQLAPRDHYDEILDMGCSTAHYTRMLAETYPRAQMTGVDLSSSTLKHAARVANANGWGWKLYQRPAENTGFDAESFDLVTSFILLHEIPAATIKAAFKEAFRLLKPGGDLVMTDVGRYADMDKLAVWRADFAAMTGGEPWWRQSASLDLAQVARDAGFDMVNAGGEKPGQFPYSVTGRKPV